MQNDSRCCRKKRNGSAGYQERTQRQGKGNCKLFTPKTCGLSKRLRDRSPVLVKMFICRFVMTKHEAFEAFEGPAAGRAWRFPVSGSWTTSSSHMSPTTTTLHSSCVEGISKQLYVRCLCL